MNKEGAPQRSVLQQIQEDRARVLAEIRAGVPIARTKVTFMKGHVSDVERERVARALTREEGRGMTYQKPTRRRY